MRGKVSRWGNSLALRVPRHLAAQAGLAEGAVVELTSRPGGIEVSLVSDEVPTLEELLAQVTDDNLHEPIDTGPAVGDEVW